MNFGIFPSRSDAKKGNPKKRNYATSSLSSSFYANRNHGFANSNAGSGASITDGNNANDRNGNNNRRSLNGNRNGVTVISVVENRAREICIAKFDTEAGSTVEIYLLTDSHSYTETLSIIEDLEPDEILLHDGCKNKVLSQKIEDAALHLFNDEPRVLYISRQYFDQDKGADMLKNILVGYVDADLIAKYTVLAGTYCLLKYIENCEGIHFAIHSLRMIYSNSIHSKLNIDRRTAINLELISNSKNGNQKTSLYGTINFTKTKVGSRFLKCNLLRPSIDLITIDTRLDTVELLLQHTKEFHELNRFLQSFPDLDKMLYGLVTLPKQLTMKTVRYSIDTLIYLKATLKLCPMMIEVLQKLSSSSSSSSLLLNNTVNRNYVTPTNNATSTTNTNNSTTSYNSNNSNNNNTTNTAQTNLLVDTLIENFSDPYFKTLQTNLDCVITDSTVYSKSSHEMRYQECFAIKSGINSLLDLARKSFLQHVEDIYVLAEEYSRQFNITTVKVMYTTSRGYHLSLPSPNSKSRHEHQEANADALASFLPPIFIQAVLTKRVIACTTEEVSSLATRAAEAIQQALALTHECIQTHILSEIRTSQKMEGLYTLTDSVALLDMLASFAHLVAVSPHTYTRPKIIDDSNNLITINNNNINNSGVSNTNTNVSLSTTTTTTNTTTSTGTSTTAEYFAHTPTNNTNTATTTTTTTSVRPSPLVIHAGCHPILNESNIQKTANSSFQPNDTYFSELNNFLIVTGPNSSGKTVFIKQVALMVVLAQIGCFVPARHAAIPIRDRILTRLGTSDDMEHNLSTFMTEMRETAYILNNVTDRSLIIIDELGRGTSNIDGLSLAFAIAEHLIGNTNAYCMFVTHYTQITTLSSMYPNVCNVHLKVALTYTDLNNNSNSSNINNHNSSSSSSSSSLSSLPHQSQPQQQQTTRECIKFTHQVGSGASELKDGYGILMSELCGFPSSMIQEARNIQKIVRNLYPVYLNPNDIDPSIGVITILLQQLLLLKNSTLNDGVLCQYLDSIRNKLSDRMVECMGIYLQHFNNHLISTTMTTPSSSSNSSSSNSSSSSDTTVQTSRTINSHALSSSSSQQQQRQRQVISDDTSCRAMTNLIPSTSSCTATAAITTTITSSDNNNSTDATNSTDAATVALLNSHHDNITSSNHHHDNITSTSHHYDKNNMDVTPENNNRYNHDKITNNDMSTSSNNNNHNINATKKTVSFDVEKNFTRTASTRIPHTGAGISSSTIDKSSISQDPTTAAGGNDDDDDDDDVIELGSITTNTRIDKYNKNGINKKKNKQPAESLDFDDLLL